MLFYGSVQDRLKTATLLGEVSAIEGAIGGLHGGQTSYDQVTTSNIVQSQNWPTKWVSNGTLISPFYTPITVTPWTYSPGDTSTDSAEVSLTGLNKSTCISLVEADFGYKVLGLLLNGANEPTNGGITVDQAVSGCQAGNTNQVVLFIS